MKKMLAGALALMLLTLVCTGALALVRHDCREKNCVCFIQRGDMGPGVAAIARRLRAMGYLKTDKTVSTFTKELDEAVRAFQKDHRMKADGLMTDNTLTWLLYGLGANDMDREYPLSDGRQVWVPTDGGTRFHTRPDCSGMSYARKLSLRNALALGFEPCSRCREK